MEKISCTIASKSQIFVLPEVDLDFKIFIISPVGGTLYNWDLITKRSYDNTYDLVVTGYMEGK